MVHVVVARRQHAGEARPTASVGQRVPSQRKADVRSGGVRFRGDCQTGTAVFLWGRIARVAPCE